MKNETNSTLPRLRLSLTPEGIAYVEAIEEREAGADDKRDTRTISLPCEH